MISSFYKNKYLKFTKTKTYICFVYAHGDSVIQIFISNLFQIDYYIKGSCSLIGFVKTFISFMFISRDSDFKIAQLTVISTLNLNQSSISINLTKMEFLAFFWLSPMNRNTKFSYAQFFFFGCCFFSNLRPFYLIDIAWASHKLSSFIWIPVSTSTNINER